MRSGLIAAFAAAVIAFAPGSASAQAFDMAAMERWSKVNIIHYAVVGEFRQKNVQIPPVDADLYGDVIERINLSFTWDRKKKVMVGAPTIRNDPAVVSNLVGMDKKCPSGKLNGAYEHLEVDEIKQGRPGDALELVGRRIHPDTMVADGCSSKLRLFKGAVKLAREFLAAPDPEVLVYAKAMPAGGPFKVTPDGKSIVMSAQNSGWVWTFTPTAK